MLTTNIPSDKQCRAYCKVMRILRETILNCYGHHVVHIGTNFDATGYEIILYVPEDHVEEYKRKYEEIREEIEEIQLNEADIAVAIQGLYVDPVFKRNVTQLPFREHSMEEPPVIGEEIHVREPPVTQKIPVYEPKKCCPVFSCFS